LLDAPPSFFRGNEPSLIRCPHSLLEDAAGLGIDLDLRLTHTSNVDDFAKRRKRENLLGEIAYFPTTTMEKESGTI
jgi:hypothetical protein